MNQISELAVNKFWEMYFKKICFIVMADYDKINFYNDDWYNKYSWNAKQEEEAIDWLFLFLTDKNNRYLIPFVTGKKKTSDKKLRIFVEEFVFNFGWNCIEDPAHVKRMRKSVWNKIVGK